MNKFDPAQVYIKKMVLWRIEKWPELALSHAGIIRIRVVLPTKSSNPTDHCLFIHRSSFFFFFSPPPRPPLPLIFHLPHASKSPVDPFLISSLTADDVFA